MKGRELIRNEGITTIYPLSWFTIMDHWRSENQRLIFVDSSLSIIQREIKLCFWMADYIKLQMIIIESVF